MGHRPMYCTSLYPEDCTKFDDRVNDVFRFDILN
jgi:hypothetical protein